MARLLPAREARPRRAQSPGARSASQAGREPELANSLAYNQAEFRSHLQDTLTEAGASDPKEQAATLITVCHGLIVRFLLHQEVVAPEEASRAAAEALGEKGCS